jgi:hypothetical protein
MAKVLLTPNLRKWVEASQFEVEAGTVREALEEVFESEPRLRGYLLDDQGELRKHVIVFVDGEMIRDRVKLSDEVQPQSEVYVAQALSGG